VRGSCGAPHSARPFLICYIINLAACLGSGPGGQSINKTENNVQLLHKPTGIRVSCQETRSLHLNRMYARRLLVQKVRTRFFFFTPRVTLTNFCTARPNTKSWLIEGGNEESKTNRKGASSKKKG
jgi:hypothetical protein